MLSAPELRPSAGRLVKLARGLPGGGGAQEAGAQRGQRRIEAVDHQARACTAQGSDAGKGEARGSVRRMPAAGAAAASQGGPRRAGARTQAARTHTMRAVGGVSTAHCCLPETVAGAPTRGAAQLACACRAALELLCLILHSQLQRVAHLHIPSPVLLAAGGQGARAADEQAGI